jgi:Tol biopolymer transport system component
MGGVERLIKSVDSLADYGTAGLGPFLSWCPDGKTLAFVDRGSLGTASIMLLDLQTLRSRQLTAPTPPLVGDTSPAFSPDGKLVAFARNGKEVSNPWVVGVDGGKPRRLSELDQMMTPGVAWDSDGASIIFGGYGLYRVALRGGNVETITSGSMIVGPAIHGHRLVFSQYSWTKKIWGINLDRNGDVIGKPELVLPSTRDQEGPSISPDGKHLVFDSLRSGYYEIWRGDVDGGNLLRLTSFQGPLTGTPSFSPDGQTVIFDSRVNGNAHIFAISPEGGPVRQLTFGACDDVMPSYSRGGGWIYFPSNRSGRWNVWKIPAQGGNPVQLTTQGGYNGVESEDGKFFFYAKGVAENGLWRVPAEGGKEEPILKEKPISGLNGYLAIQHRRLFYADSQNPDFQSRTITIHSYDLATGKDRELLTMDYPPAFGPPGLAVSRDGTRLLFVTQENSGADLQTVENFR